MLMIGKISYLFDEEDKKLIQKQLIDKNLTMNKLAKQCEVSNAYMSDILNGKRAIPKKIFIKLEESDIKLNVEWRELLVRHTVIGDIKWKN